MNELLVLALLIAVNACNATTYDSTNVGFELWFTSENTEVSDFELKIDGSLPEWLSVTISETPQTGPELKTALAEKPETLIQQRSLRVSW